VAQIERPAERAVSLEQVQERAREAARDVRQAVTGQHGGYGYGDPSTAYVDALRSMYRPPWELALQRWLEAATPSERSYARPSRRGADRADAVLPGRAHTGWTLSIVLDTSGSMADELAPALGVIASFCESVGVEQVRILQCDTAVERDELVDVDRLAHFAISGFGGSNLSPALEWLAHDPEVEAAVVLTDGAILYPRAPMPYLLLWVLTSKNDGFRPPYGQVIELQP
jgi:predicted metal-dependent peptidase